jgi:N6-L-threonylcarbamoyladenine synthase
MLVLGIESSCDETAIAVLKDGRKVLSSKVSSQLSHSLYGGVIPEIAAREHLETILPLYQEALDEAKASPQDLDLICATQGPGLIGALLVGTSFAKGLASSLKKPLLPVNHVHAHIHGALLGLSDYDSETLFPSLALVVSGGHTHVYAMQTPIDFRLLVSSIDDACGECFDKVAKLLGLGYPGGPAVEALAKKGNPKAIPMPRMMEQKDKLAFSYSGLKTHVRYLLEKEQSPIPLERMQDICAAFQKEAFDQIFRKLEIAISLHPETRSILISGGVAANAYFREQMKKNFPIPSHFPDLKYCSDNAAMIAALGYEIYTRNRNPQHYLDYKWETFSRYQ